MDLGEPLLAQHCWPGSHAQALLLACAQTALLGSQVRALDHCRSHARTLARRALPGVWAEQDRSHRAHERHKLQVRGARKRFHCPQVSWHSTRISGVVVVCSASCSWHHSSFVPKLRSHKSTTARETLVAGKTVYDAAVATQQPVDVTSIYGHTKALFDDARHRMVVGQFQPVLDPATLHCRSTLSWWVQA